MYPHDSEHGAQALPIKHGNILVGYGHNVHPLVDHTLEPYKS